MDRPIQVGDLVVKVGGCCSTYNGAVRKVVGSGTLHNLYCQFCGYTVASSELLYFERGPDPIGGKREWYKRIPPLDELEGTRTEETLRSPKETA